MTMIKIELQLLKEDNRAKNMEMEKEERVVKRKRKEKAMDM
jgi:hypothetical protein